MDNNNNKNRPTEGTAITMAHRVESQTSKCQAFYSV